MGQAIAQVAVHNMMAHCAGIVPGQRVLIAYEPDDFGLFDAAVSACVAAQARAMGYEVALLDVGFDPDATAFPPALIEAMKDVDAVVFLARLGDQLRFREMPPPITFVNCYTLNTNLLQSPFATVHHHALLGLKGAVDQALAEAQEVVITCPNGTHVRGFPDLRNRPATDTSLKRFPMSVFSPVPAVGFSGRVALGGFLTGTGSRYYDSYTVEFDSQVFAHLEAGRLVGFTGRTADVHKADAQYDRVSNLLGIDRNFVHSWHAGIHPGCGFPWPLRENYDLWGGAAFGNPRILHFHTCGAYVPGEISWNVFDPTITLDGVAYWQEGVFRADLLSRGPEILGAYPCAAACFAQPDRNIGLSARA